MEKAENGSESDLSDDIFRPTSKKSMRPSPNEPVISTDDKSVKKRKLSSFTCKFCKAQFAYKYNRNRHESNCRANTSRTPSRFSCAHCNTSFDLKQSLTHHVNKCPFSKSNHQKYKNPCLVKNCGAKFFLKTHLIQHMSISHQDVITIQPKVTKTFPSIEEFNVWKEKEEESTFSYFTARKGQASKAVKHYYCQHDGSEKLHNERTSNRRRSKGRVKVGHICIALMKVTEHENKSVHVDYYPTHSHICKKEDVLHHPIPAAMSKFINEKLAENMLPKDVYELTKERFLQGDNLDLPTRAGNLNRKMVLERWRKMRLKRELNKNDAEALIPISPLENFKTDKNNEELEEEHFCPKDILGVPKPRACNLKKRTISERTRRKQTKRPLEKDDAKVLVPVEGNFYNFETDEMNEELDMDFFNASETSFNDNSKMQNIIEQMKRDSSRIQQFVKAAEANSVPEHTIIHVSTVLSDLARSLEPVIFQEKAQEINIMNIVSNTLPTSKFM